MQPVLQSNIAANKNEIHSDVAHFTTHGSNLSCKKSGCCKKAKLLQKVENSSICFCNKICTCCASNWLLSNLFCSKWRKSRVWRDFRVIVSNQKSVFTQLLTQTRFVVRQVWTWVVKCPTYEANQAARFFVVRFNYRSFRWSITGADCRKNDYRYTVLWFKSHGFSSRSP